MPARVGAVVPTFGRLRLGEAAELLQGLVRINVRQLREGEQPVSPALQLGSAPWGRRIRYERADPGERWQTIRDLWASGWGDCEDLAAAVAAEMTVGGLPARVVLYRARPGLAHAVVQDALGRLHDPSRWAGMGEV